MSTSQPECTTCGKPLERGGARCVCDERYALVGLTAGPDKRPSLDSWFRLVGSLTNDGGEPITDLRLVLDPSWFHDGSEVDAGGVSVAAGASVDIVRNLHAAHHGQFDAGLWVGYRTLGRSWWFRGTLPLRVDDPRGGHRVHIHQELHRVSPEAPRANVNLGSSDDNSEPPPLTPVELTWAGERGPALTKGRLRRARLLFGALTAALIVALVWLGGQDSPAPAPVATPGSMAEPETEPEDPPPPRLAEPALASTTAPAESPTLARTAGAAKSPRAAAPPPVGEIARRLDEAEPTEPTPEPTTSAPSRRTTPGGDGPPYLMTQCIGGSADSCFERAQGFELGLHNYRRNAPEAARWYDEACRLDHEASCDARDRLRSAASGGSGAR